MPTNGEMTQLKIHLLSALDGVKIRRYTYTEQGIRDKVAQTIAVPLKYGHKTRQIHEAIQFNGHIELPAISVTFNGLTRDESRCESKKTPMTDRGWGGKDGYVTVKKPVPVNFAFTLNIVTTKGSDLEEIISHYISVFNPYIQLSWREPHTNNKVISKVTWDGNVQTQMPTDTDSAKKIRYVASLGLTVEGWFYPAQNTRTDIIKTIELNSGITKKALEQGWYDEPDIIDPDKQVFHGRPSILELMENKVLTGGRVDAWGESLHNIRALFIQPPLSSGIPMSSYNPFEYSENLSATNGEFNAIMIDEFDVHNTAHISFNVPEYVTGGVDILTLDQYFGVNKYSETHSDCDKGSLYITPID